MKITIESKQLKQATIGLNFVERNIPKAMTSALNRVGTEVKTAASREIRKRYDVRATDIKKYGKINVTRASTATMQLILKSVGPSIPLIRFRTRPSRPPIRRPKVLTASVKRSGGKPIPGAFVALMGSGHVGVFKRVGKRRNPIQELYGPAVPVMLGEDGVAENLNEVAQKSMNKRLNHEVNRVLGRFKAT